MELEANILTMGSKQGDEWTDNWTTLRETVRTRVEMRWWCREWAVSSRTWRNERVTCRAGCRDRVAEMGALDLAEADC